MPRRPPSQVRTGTTNPPSDAVTSTLLVSRCPGPPTCTGVHAYLFVDGLALITRSYSGAACLHPRQLLRPGGPLYPRDTAREVTVASLVPSDPNSGGLVIRVRLAGETIAWTDLMYPDLDGRLVDEVRFDLGQYLGELERAYREWIYADGQDPDQSRTRPPDASGTRRTRAGQEASPSDSRSGL